MAIVAQENFDSYLNASNLGGQNGGTGWSGAWSDITGSRIVQNTTVVSGNAVSVNSSGVASLQRRTFSTPISNYGYCSFYLRKDSTRRRHSVFFKTGGTYRGGMGMGQAGDLGAYANNIYVADANTNVVSVVNNYNVGQWYFCEFEFDIPLNRIRGRVDNGAFSAWISMGGAGNIDIIELFYDAAVNDGADIDNITIYNNPISAITFNSLYAFGGI